MTTTRRFATTHRKNRATRRGAAMIEAIMTVGLFTCMLGGGELLRRAYQSRLTLMDDVRSRVWREAMQGCGEPPNQNSLAQAAKSFQHGTPSISAETVQTWFGITKRSASGTEVVTVPTLSAAEEETNQRTLRVSHTVACNERPIDNTGVMQLFGLFRNIVDL